MGRKRKGRAINGVILVDKHQGDSSNHVLQQVKRIFGAAKAGHTGALDPLATGMLPICLGEATKFSQFLLDADKTYEVTAKLGERTDTSDADGEIVERKEVLVDTPTIEQTIMRYVGASKQVPSMFSALKHNGRPLYYYARQGIEVERSARDITIYAIDILNVEQQQFSMRVHCSKGTYIRSLVDDIGQDLACGAHVSSLRRVGVAHYPVDKMLTVEDLEAIKEADDYQGLDSHLLPMDTAILNLASCDIQPEQTTLFQRGMVIPCDDVQLAETPIDSFVRVYSDGEFLGLAIYLNKQLQPKRVVVYPETT